MKPKIEEYQQVGWPSLQALSDNTCPCCGDHFNETMQPELQPKCHKGPVYVSYWDGFLYIRCGTCDQPVCKVAIDKSLL